MQPCSRTVIVERALSRAHTHNSENALNTTIKHTFSHFYFFEALNTNRITSVLDNKSVQKDIYWVKNPIVISVGVSAESEAVRSETLVQGPAVLRGQI